MGKSRFSVCSNHSTVDLSNYTNYCGIQDSCLQYASVRTILVTLFFPEGPLGKWQMCLDHFNSAYSNCSNRGACLLRKSTSLYLQVPVIVQAVLVIPHGKDALWGTSDPCFKLFYSCIPKGTGALLGGIPETLTSN